MDNIMVSEDLSRLGAHALPPRPASLPAKPLSQSTAVPNTPWVAPPAQVFSSASSIRALSTSEGNNLSKMTDPKHESTSTPAVRAHSMGLTPSPSTTYRFDSSLSRVDLKDRVPASLLGVKTALSSATSASIKLPPKPITMSQSSLATKSDVSHVPVKQAFVFPVPTASFPGEVKKVLISPREVGPSDTSPSGAINLNVAALSNPDDKALMPPPSVPVKRKIQLVDDNGNDDDNMSIASSSFSHAPSMRLIKREPSATPGPDGPEVIPILPIPLPSKRFKKNAGSRAVLIPVEQLPVFPLPPLPVIDNPILVKQVFTHQSCFPGTRGRFEDPEDDPGMHYEKLEHVGDSILGMLVTTWLHEVKPNLTCGTATKLKAHMVSNATLSHLSGMYNMPQRLVGHPQLLPVLRAQTDIRAALMEAYIAALYFSFPVEKRMTEGLGVIDGWLREMYDPLFDFFFNYMKAEWDQHHSAIGENPDGTVQTISPEEMARIDNAAMGMAPLVQMYATRHDRELRFEEERFYTNMGSLWRIKCTLDGIELGEATRANKRMAKNVAAWEGAKKLGLTTE